MHSIAPPCKDQEHRAVNPGLGTRDSESDPGSAANQPSDKGQVTTSLYFFILKKQMPRKTTSPSTGLEEQMPSKGPAAPQPALPHPDQAPHSHLTCAVREERARALEFQSCTQSTSPARQPLKTPASNVPHLSMSSFLGDPDSCVVAAQDTGVPGEMLLPISGLKSALHS